MPEATVNPNRLHGVKAARREIAEEKPYMRHAAHLFALGCSTAEVAVAVEKDAKSVRLWLQQPWFQERITSIMDERGGSDIMDLFRAEAFSSLSTLIELRDNSKTSPSVRAKVSDSILDRGFGKAKQTIETKDSSVRSADPVQEAERLEKENRRLQGNN